MKIKLPINNKRGMALESAIVFMLIVFMLCSLILTLTVIGHRQREIENTLLLQKVELDGIGEDFLAGELGDYEKYEYLVSGDTLTVWHKNDTSKTAVLYVEVERDGADVSILSWRYSQAD